MAIFDFFKKKTDVSITEERSMNVQPMSLNLLTSDFRLNNSLNLSAVYRCVQLISDTVASLPLKLYKLDSKGNKIPLNNELSYVLGKKPNKKMTYNTMMKCIVKDIYLYGNAYLYIKKDKTGKISQLIYLHPNMVNPIERIDDIIYKVNGVGDVKQEDILHFIQYTDNGWKGVSVLHYAKRALGIAEYADESAESFYKSGGSKYGYLKLEGASTSKQREDIMTAWHMSKGADGRLAGLAVLPANVSFEDLSIDPENAQYIDARKFQVYEIARFFGVPVSKLYDKDGVSYNSVEAEQIAFLNDTIRPLITKIEQELERKLFGYSVDLEVKFDTTEMLRNDKTSLANYYRTMASMGVLSINEIRNELDLPTIEGGDIHTVQVNLVDLTKLDSVNYKDNRLKEDEEE